MEGQTLGWKPQKRIRVRVETGLTQEETHESGGGLRGSVDGVETLDHPYPKL